MNKIYLIVAVATFVARVGLCAAQYPEIPMQYDRATTAEVAEVKLLETRITTDVTGNYQNRYIEIVLGIKSLVSICETTESIRVMNLQRSLESPLNPTDYYFRVYTRWKPGCATGSYGPPVFNQMKMKFFVDQRNVSDANQPWPSPGAFWTTGAIKQFNFDVGMSGGYNRWGLYRLNLVELEHPKFEFKKIYSYVQGEVINQ